MSRGQPRSGEVARPPRGRPQAARRSASRAYPSAAEVGREEVSRLGDYKSRADRRTALFDGSVYGGARAVEFGLADGVYDDMRDHLKARFGETVCFAEVKGRQGLLEKLGAMQAAAAAQQRASSLVTEPSLSPPRSLPVGRRRGAARHVARHRGDGGVGGARGGAARAVESAPWSSIRRVLAVLHRAQMLCERGGVLSYLPPPLAVPSSPRARPISESARTPSPHSALVRAGSGSFLHVLFGCSQHSSARHAGRGADASVATAYTGTAALAAARAV